MRYAAFFSLALLSTVALAACGKAPDPEATKEPANTGLGAKVEAQAAAKELAPLSEKKFGTGITEKTNTSLNDLMKEPGKFTEKTVRTEGVVSAVCQSMGCWMEIKDTAGQAHIKMAGHSFFIPKAASGHRAVVQGKVLNAEKDHCTEEAEAQTGQVAKVQLEATGVEIVD
jgi:Domain of unknown function (DUF4920)